MKASGALALGASRCRRWPRPSPCRSATASGRSSKYPQKRPMIGLTSRPPQLETPFAVFNENVITPNDAFFVRYHLANIPFDTIDPDAWTARDQGRGQQAAEAQARRPEAHALGRVRRRQPVLGQQPRLLRAARPRRPVRQRRDGQRALEGRAAQGGARPGGREGRRQADLLLGLRRAGDRQDAEVRQGARHRPCARRRGDDRLPDERRRPAGAERLPGPHDRAGLVRHLLDEAPQRDHRARQGVRRLLDEERLSHPRHRRTV